MVGAVSCRYQEKSSSLGEILCILVEWYVDISTSKCDFFGSYDMLLGMDWFYIHMTKVDYYDNAI